jgi:hypothetical protein
MNGVRVQLLTTKSGIPVEFVFMPGSFLATDSSFATFIYVSSFPQSLPKLGTDIQSEAPGG